MKLGLCVGVLALGLVVGCSKDRRGLGDAGPADAGSGRPDAASDGGAADAARADAGTCATDLVGSWGITAIEGAPPPPPDSSNSTWIFNADGTYTWCLNYAGYVLNDSGNYTLDGAWLAVDGMVWELTATNPIPLFDCTADSFRFRDDEGDVWTYARDATATGCVAP